METYLLLGVMLTWLLLMEISLEINLLGWTRYRPTPEIRIGLNAMKNFGRFAVIFAVLYWIQVQFGDAEAWLDAFQRN